MMRSRKEGRLCILVKQTGLNIISHPDNSINNQFLIQEGEGKSFSMDWTACMQHVESRTGSAGFRVADKSGGQVWYVNMSASLARYSQLLLQDLSRDLMLISKKTESCRLSMTALES